MASIRVEITIDAPEEPVWAALRDFGAVHKLAPGFIVGTQLDGQDRIVTFYDGVVVREALVDLDDDAHRLAWTIVKGPYTHHNGVAKVASLDDGRARFIWTTDLLPNEFADRTAARMERGARVIRETLESAAGRA
jgi:hypothetical protein